ncbi:hypothetical protein AGMMS50256_31130 [Betaproteobacteria bacterium]|nr:hypothetical protein AGMMS50256_31130 [Betaproteobacteria bacterium]
MNKTITLPGFVLTLSLFATAATAETMWVHGSWVNVRETAEAQSAVIEHVTTNTKVEVAARDGKTCEIVWGEAKRGFVPCRLLGEKALTLKSMAVEGEAQYSPYDPAPQYSPPRAFWIAPSALSLLETGLYFQRTLLSEKQWELEHGRQENGDFIDMNKPPKLIRYPVPEFEVMKTLLAEGVIAASYWDLPLVSCQQRQAAQTKQFGVSNNFNFYADNMIPWGQWFEITYPDLDLVRFSYTWRFWNKQGMLFENCQDANKLLHLPKVRPSFFKNTEDILPGNAYIEQISARFNIVERGKIVGSPRWEYSHHHDQTAFTGAWDIGRYELKLDKPIIEHVIGRNGQVRNCYQTN